MKRVLLLALLMVSAVVFTMERERMYLVFAALASASLIYSLIRERRRPAIVPTACEDAVWNDARLGGVLASARDDHGQVNNAA